MTRDDARARKTVVGTRPWTLSGLETWIDEVAATADNDLRAHRITLTYSRLAEHLDKLIHGAEAASRCHSLNEAACNANWFHFATWANRTVTHNISSERMPSRVNSGVAAPLRRRLTPAVLQPQASQGQRVARALSWGQRLIFVATCLTLLEFSRHQRKNTEFRKVLAEDSTVADKITALATWGDQVWFSTERHFEPIWRAFELYELARHATTDAGRARLVLGANVLLMAVDQDLIDRALRIVVDQTPQRITGAVDWRLAKLVERFRGVPPQLSYVVLQSRHENERRMIDAVWSRMLTDQVLVLALPTETLRVGRDVPARHREWPYFPPDLRDLDAATGEADAEIKAALIDVARHVDSLDRTAGAGRGSAARDWRRWDERMNWILTLLRSRQQDDTLFWKPFSPRDSRRIVEGELPLGAGDPTGRVQPPIGLGVFPTVAAPRSNK